MTQGRITQAQAASRRGTRNRSDRAASTTDAISDQASVDAVTGPGRELAGLYAWAELDRLIDLARLVSLDFFDRPEFYKRVEDPAVVKAIAARLHASLYSSVAFSDDRSAVKIKSIAKTASNHVALWIRPPLLGRPPGQSHMITVEGPIAIDDAADKVTFDYWEHGKPVATLKTTFTVMKANHLGSITATF